MQGLFEALFNLSSQILLARLGRALENQIDSAILQHIPWDGWTTFTELHKSAEIPIRTLRGKEQYRITEETLSQHLKKFQQLGLVIHNAEGYRRSYLDRDHVRVFVGPHIVVGGKPIVNADGNPDGMIDFLREQARSTGSFWASGQVMPGTLTNPDTLYEVLAYTFTDILNACMSLFESTATASDRETAHEIVNLLIDAEIRRYVTSLARLFWDHKKEVSFKSLQGRELRFIISNMPWGTIFVQQPSSPPLVGVSDEKKAK